eukprot:11704501-Alexandrium_andersonii.AAC.1
MSVCSARSRACAHAGTPNNVVEFDVVEELAERGGLDDSFLFDPELAEQPSEGMGRRGVARWISGN